MSNRVKKYKPLVGSIRFCCWPGHWLWRRNRRALALFFQSRISELFGVDIHPNARLGRGIMIDHATGVGGVPDFVQDRGLLIPPGDATAAVAAAAWANVGNARRAATAAR